MDRTKLLKKEKQCYKETNLKKKYARPIEMQFVQDGHNIMKENKIDKFLFLKMQYVSLISS